MHIAMIGSAYVGLVSGTGRSEFGHSVICVNRHKAKITALMAEAGFVYVSVGRDISH